VSAPEGEALTLRGLSPSRHPGAATRSTSKNEASVKEAFEQVASDWFDTEAEGIVILSTEPTSAILPSSQMAVGTIPDFGTVLHQFALLMRTHARISQMEHSNVRTSYRGLYLY
jgi:hypothetical protein